MNLKNTAVLVTGGAGFIGSHVVEKLVSKGAHVTVLDNLSTGTLDNLEKVKHSITFLRGDIVDLETCITAAKHTSIIFHLAAKVSVAESVENPQLCYETNVIGTANMLDAALKNNVSRFIFSSSAAVYGFQENQCHEEMTCKPESPYGHSKLIGELLCQRYWRLYGLETVCLRYFNMYGERQKAYSAYSSAIATFKAHLEKNEPITIFGNGLQTRDFTPVSLAVEANEQMAIFDKKYVAGHVFNIASGRSVTLLALIEQLKKDYPHFCNEIKFIPARPGDIVHSAADIGKYKRLTKSS
jgi:nucleoside-diphosphate-sugar epimerase